MGTASSREEMFYEACGYGATPKVKKMLDEGINVNFVSLSGQSYPIHIAAQGKPDIVKLLINAKCDVNVRDHVDKLPIHHAAMKNRSDVIEALIAAGSKIDVFDKNHWTPIITAAYFGCLDAVKTLLKHKCDVHLSNKDDRTALHEACRSRSNIEVLPEIVSVLITAGCVIDAKSADTGEADFTPLMFASYHGHTEVVQTLISAGSDLNVQGTNEWTALHWAADRGHTEVIQLLIDKGADPNIKNKRGELAVNRTKKIEIKRILQPDVEHKEPEPPAPKPAVVKAPPVSEPLVDESGDQRKNEEKSVNDGEIVAKEEGNEHNDKRTPESTENDESTENVPKENAESSGYDGSTENSERTPEADVTSQADVAHVTRQADDTKTGEEIPATT